MGGRARTTASSGMVETPAVRNTTTPDAASTTSSANPGISSANPGTNRSSDVANGASDIPNVLPPLDVVVDPMPRHGNRYKVWLMAADAIAIVVGLAAAIAVQAAVKPVPWFGRRDEIVLSLLSLPGFAIGAGANRMYRARANERPGEELLNVCKTVAVGVGTIVLIATAVTYKSLSRFWILTMFVTVVACLVAERRVARRVFQRLRSNRRLCRRIVIVGTDGHAIGLLHRYQRNPRLGYEVVGFIGDDDIGVREGVGVLGTVAQLPEVLQRHRCVGVVIAQTSVPSRDVNLLTRRLTDAGYHVTLSSTLRDIDISRLRPQELDGQTLIYVEPVIRTGWRAIAKRAFDLVLASTVLVLTLPILLAAMIAVRLESGGPVIFKQVRVGRHGEVFTLYKLRTMVADAEDRKAELAQMNEADGPLFKIAADPRITRVGRFLRSTSVDELPQLFCVLRGKMSMVGPRPALPDEVAQWDDEVRERLRVLPGLTGLWQVSGRSDSSFEQYKRMDLLYVDNWSLYHDVMICGRTVGAILARRGAS